MNDPELPPGASRDRQGDAAVALRFGGAGLHRGEDFVRLWTTLALSFFNTFAFFGFHRLYFDVAELRDRPGWMQAMGGAQTVLGFAFLFFLGLGFRLR